MPSLPFPSLPTPAIPVRRHISVAQSDGGICRTTLRLEQAFWREIDRQSAAAGMTWRDWATKTLTAKPSGIGAASWLRVNCVRGRK